jgi:iron(III) transport system ATP-binding protein
VKMTNLTLKAEVSDSHDGDQAGAGPILRISDLRKRFVAKGKADDVPALDGVDLQVSQGEFFTLLGPSGCGKTTTLRCIAGLESPDQGDIVVAGTPLYSASANIDVAPNRRNLGMVFQSYAIWPHMDVAANVAFPLRARPRKQRPSSAQIQRKVAEALEKVELSHASRRRATDLSGGQQQRLALARALVMEAPLTLFDEPLSNLDAKLRDVMRFELKRLQRELGLTAIYVTHDQTEALSMSNRIAVMRAGKVEQLGTPREIYDNPASLFVADFIGTTNLLTGQVKAHDVQDTYVVASKVGDLRAHADNMGAVSIGSSVTVSVRPQYVHMVEEPNTVTEGGPGCTGRVRQRAYLGEYVDHVVDVEGVELRVRASARQTLPPGTEVRLTFDEQACVLVPETTSAAD